MNYLPKYILYFFITLITCTLMNFAKAENNMTDSKTLVLAMGCFWCGESEFRDHDTLKPLNGILDLKVGYAGDALVHTDNNSPTYENHDGFREALKITYDPTIISYEQLLEIFWKNVDLYDDKGQFCDKGFAYTAALFFNNDDEKEQAYQALENITKDLKNKDIKTLIIPFKNFYDAEEYHQNYKQKNPVRYKYYRWNCGRDQRLKEIWQN